MSSQSAPTRTLPHQPNLAQLRKQAKELLNSYRAGQAATVGEVERFERNPDPAIFVLADAQRVLARAYGFPSWAKLKQYVDGVNVEAFCAAADAGDVATVRTLATARPELVNTERGGKYGEWMALHFAVLNRDANMTRALMELGADARAGIWPHRDATAACTIARERGYADVVAIIEQAEERRRKEMSAPGATVNSKTDEILKAIAERQCEEAIPVLESDLSLIGACNQRGAMPLHVAAWTHNPTMVAWLLDRQAAANARDAEGKTPLDYAAIVAGWAEHGQRAFMENAQQDPALFHETVRLLRAAGAELTPRAAVAVGDKAAVLQMHHEGRLKTEIHTLRGGLIAIAVRVNRLEMVSLLLDLGFDPDEPVAAEDGGVQSWGMPLWFASMCARQDIAELLLARGADVNAIVYACGDSLCMAADEKMEALLLQHGARLTVEQVSDLKTVQAILDGTVSAYSLNVDDPTPTDLAEQMLCGAVRSDPEIVRMCLPHVQRKPDDPWWNYVLVHSALPECLQLVLDYGVDPDVTADGGGYTNLHHLATEYANAQERIALATILLDAGASLNKRDQLLKSTPLGWACRWGRIDLVQLYLQRGADTQEPGAEAWATPLAWATKGNHHEIIKLLRAHNEVGQAVPDEE